MPHTWMTTDAEAIGLPFEEAVSFFREKANVPTRRWNDIWRGEHSHQFMVAGATSDALLGDFKSAIQKALDHGTTLEEFRKDFDKIVEKHGWEYNGGRNWRSRIIYETNLATSYSAGRYAQLTEPETLKAFPFWMYRHSGSRHPRLQHLAWDGLTLRADDAFWETHYPPNGWRCGCRVVPRDGNDLTRMGKSGPDKSPPIEYRDWRDRVTGKVHQVPVGIDPGWDYNPGLEKGRVKSDPMQAVPGLGTPRAPGKTAPLPPVPSALERFLAQPSEEGVTAGRLPEQVRRAIGADGREVVLYEDAARELLKTTPAKQWGVLPEIVRNPTVGLKSPAGGKDARRVLMLRQSGSVWMAELHPALSQTGHLTEMLVQAFERLSPAEVIELLGQHDQVFGDADLLDLDSAE